MGGYVRLSKILAKSNGNIYFECPGCEIPHGINCGDGHGQLWSFNGDVNNPTFSPSVLVDFTYGAEKKREVCHSFVRNGKIEFLSDCTHELAGKIVDIPEWNTVCEGE